MSDINLDNYPEIKPAINALIRVAAASYPRRDLDAEQLIIDMLTSQLDELVRLRAAVENAEELLVQERDGWRAVNFSALDAALDVARVSKK
jgi:hypothetical protein